MRITYRGGNSCYYLVEARGRSGVFSGNIAIHDAMREVYADPGRFTEV